MRAIASLGAGATLAAAGAETSPPTAAPVVATPAPDAVPRRALGRTGAQVSVLGVGGHHLGDFKRVDDAVDMIRYALDAGINFFDNCWEYYNGLTETILGRALQGRRDRAFVMTKVCTHGRGAEIAMRMLEESLRRLQTDHLDLWQIHAISYDNDPDLVYAKGGVLDAFERAKKQGKVRFVGFSGHKDPVFHLRMLELGYAFDTVQMPLNPFDYNYHSFEKQVLPEVNRRGMAALGMKSMGGTAGAVSKGLVEAKDLLRYAMSLPVATTISGMDSLDMLQRNLAVARGFQPMAAADMDALRARCAEAAADGRYELYKGTLKFDNPVTRMPHGFPIDAAQKEVKAMFEKANGSWQPG